MADKHRYSDEQKDRDTLKSLYSLNNSYRETSRDFEAVSGVRLHPSMVRMLIKGYNPGKKIRKLLNWCPLSLAPACLRCGRVHTTKRCTANSNGSPRRQPPVRVAELTASERAEVLAQTPAERKRRLLDEMQEWY